MANVPIPKAPALAYLDRPEIPETFVDSPEKVIFDPVTCRIEFVVNRFDPAAPGAPMAGKKVTACRLVLPLPGLLNLAQQINQVIESLKQQGVLKPVVTPEGPKSVN